MKTYLTGLFLVLTISFGACLSSCASVQRALTPTHTIDAEAVGPLILSVCDRHDELVARDTVLVPAEKEQALRSSRLLRDIVAEAVNTPNTSVEGAAH